MQPYNVRTTKKDLIARLEKHNINTWKNDPLSQEIYSNATNPNRTEKDNIRLRELEAQRNKRDHELGFTSTEPVQEYPTQAETQAKRVMEFSNLPPKSRRFKV